MKNIVLGAARLVALAIATAGCTPEVGSERWCKQLAEKPKTQWSMSEVTNYARHCLLESTSVGSASWCRKLADKPKGDWSANEAADYAKHCLLKPSGEK